MNGVQGLLKGHPSLRRAKSRHEEGRLSLFVGAGFSKSCRLPRWDELVDKVVERAWPTGEFESVVKAKAHRKGVVQQGLEAAVDLAEMRGGPGEPRDTFVKIVKQCLYGDTETLELSPTARATAKLKNVREICCLNFDNVLEEAYQRDRADVAAIPVVRDKQVPEKADVVVIYHAHGYLPHGTQGNQTSREELVLGEKDYFKHFMEPYSWPNLIQLKLFMTTSVLFIGFSFKDRNTMRLLFRAKQMNLPYTHFALLRDPTSPAFSERERDKEASAIFDNFMYRLKELNVAPITYEDHKYLPDLLNFINGTGGISQ
ncbi:MAG: SIR2 family protein [Thermodesulfobacteriota bacterium]